MEHGIYKEDRAQTGQVPQAVQKAEPLRQGIVESLIFLTITTLLGRGSQVLATVALAKLLSVADFGVVNIVAILINTFMLVRLSFFFQTLMRRQTQVREAADVSFWGSVISGFLLWMLAIVMAPAVASFFHSPLVTPVLRISGLAFFISSIGMVPDSLFEKELQFRRKSMAEAAQPFIYAVAAIVLALLGFGVYAIAWAQVISSGIWAIWIFAISPYRPSFKIDWKVFREEVLYGRFVFGAALVALAFNNLDNASIAHIFGARALGYYALAFTFATFVSVNVTGLIVSSVLLPVFSKLQNNMAAQRQALDKTLRYVGLYTAPFAVGTFVLAPVFMHALYGHKWDGAIMPLRILSLYGWCNSYNTLLGSVCNGLGRARAAAWLTTVRLVLVLPLIAWAPEHFFISGTAGNFTIARVGATIVSFIYIERLLRMGTRTIVWRLALPLFVALCAGAGVVAFQAFTQVGGHLALLLEVIVYMAIFIAIYAVVDADLFIQSGIMLWRRATGRRTPVEPATMQLPSLPAAAFSQSLASFAAQGGGSDTVNLFARVTNGTPSGYERPTLRPMRLTALDEQQPRLKKSPLVLPDRRAATERRGWQAPNNLGSDASVIGELPDGE